MPKRKEQAQATTDELNPQQLQFVAEYLIDLNATQAAIRAGYSAKTANQQASRLLAHVKISAAIAEAKARRLERTEITADRVLEELAKIGFSDIRKAVRWANEPRKPDITGDDPDAPEILESSVLLVPSDEIDPDIAAAISEVSHTAQGIKIKFYDKRAALVDLGKHIGMFRDQVDVNHNVRFVIDGLEQPKSGGSG